MSKLGIFKDNVKIDDIENRLIEFNKYLVVVEVEYIEALKSNNIPFRCFYDHENFYLCRQGRKKKKFNDEQIQAILKDIENGLSIRKCATKYKCSTKTIQNIKLNRY